MKLMSKLTLIVFLLDLFSRLQSNNYAAVFQPIVITIRSTTANKLFNCLLPLPLKFGERSSDQPDLGQAVITDLYFFDSGGEGKGKFIAIVEPERPADRPPKPSIKRTDREAS